MYLFHHYHNSITLTVQASKASVLLIVGESDLFPFAVSTTVDLFNGNIAQTISLITVLFLSIVPNTESTLETSNIDSSKNRCTL